MVPMRDGVKLNTIVFIPIVLNAKEYAVVMERTPYGADNLKGDGEMWVNDGFVAVMQDFRGRYASEGKFEMFFNASTDGIDTINWIIEQSWSNKVVFSYGISADGIAAYMLQISKPNFLIHRAQFVLVGSAEMHKTDYGGVERGGALDYDLISGWLAGIDESSFFPNVTEHEAFSDYWVNVTMTNKWDQVTCPAVHLSGWYDIFNQQQLDAFQGYQTESAVGKGQNYLIVTPGGHCPGGQVQWPNGDNGVAAALALAVVMFKALADPAVHPDDLVMPNVDTVQWYVLGPGLPNTTGNYWTGGPTFPTSTPWIGYLGASGTLSTSLPSEDGSTSYVYDPTYPCPTIGGNNLLMICGPWDQSTLEARSDVISFTSPVLPEEFAITGHMYANLFVSSNCTDTDFTAKITDVFPNGTSLLVQDGIIRMRWYANPEVLTPITPGEVYNITVDIWSTSYIFPAGHQVRVDISSSNYPRFSANTNTGQPIDGLPGTVPALNTIYYGPKYPSALILPEVSLDDLPQKTPFSNRALE